EPFECEVEGWILAGQDQTIPQWLERLKLLPRGALFHLELDGRLEIGLGAGDGRRALGWSSQRSLGNCSAAQQLDALLRKDDRRRLVHTSSAMRSLLFSEWPILTQAAGSRSRVSLRELGGRI